MSTDNDEHFIQEVEGGDEFDEASRLTTHFCKSLTAEEYEEEAENETRKAIANLMGYLDGHKDEFAQLLKKKKREDLENGGIFSLVKVKVYDMIHGNNSPLIRVTEQERDKKLAEMKSNMRKAFIFAQEAKGRRSQRLEDMRLKKANETSNKPTGNTHQTIVPAPPPAPALPPFIEAINTPTTKILPRKPLTPIENRINLQTKTPCHAKDMDDTFEPLPSLNCSLTSLHQELLSSNPWKRLKTVDDNKSPGGTPRKSRKMMNDVSSEPLHRALLNKFKNVRSPSPASSSLITSPGDFTP